MDYRIIALIIAILCMAGYYLLVLDVFCLFCSDEACPGMYSNSGCDGSCSANELCGLVEGTNCYVCAPMQTTCEQRGLFSTSDCDDTCNEDNPCSLHSAGCYACQAKPCADLVISDHHVNISRSATCYCKGQECENDCNLGVRVDLEVANAGPGPVDASLLRVEVTPDVAIDEIQVNAMGSGEADAITKTYSKSEKLDVCGIKACEQLPWWSLTFTTTITADADNAIDECDESNNQVVVETAIS